MARESWTPGTPAADWRPFPGPRARPGGRGRASGRPTGPRRTRTALDTRRQAPASSSRQPDRPSDQPRPELRCAAPGTAGSRLLPLRIVPGRGWRRPVLPRSAGRDPAQRPNPALDGARVRLDRGSTGSQQPVSAPLSAARGRLTAARCRIALLCVANRTSLRDPRPPTPCQFTIVARRKSPIEWPENLAPSACRCRGRSFGSYRRRTDLDRRPGVLRHQKCYGPVSIMQSIYIYYANLQRI